MLVEDFNQLTFLITKNITIGNRPIFLNDIPDNLKENEDIIKITNYNNQHGGIITNNFFIWALENNLSFESVQWFINDFSHQNNEEINSIIDAFFKKYKIYFDESSNCVKFRFKDENGKTNVNWFNDFVLAGVVYDKDKGNFDIDYLFEEFQIQKNIVDVKLKHLSDYNGEDNNRFLDIIKSKRISLLLQSLLKTDSIYIHWSTQSLLYFSLVDIVDTVFDIPFCLNEAKNVLYNFALEDPSLLKILAHYQYPNIKNDQIEMFCQDFIDWIESLHPSNTEEYFLLELLRQGTKSVKKSKKIILLQNNTDRLLIDNFVPIYAMRLSTFPNSDIHFDQCGIVEQNIEEVKEIFCTNKTPLYDFLNSKESRWIQLSDIIAGIIGAFMAYINTNNLSQIKNSIAELDDIQIMNLKLFIELKLKSAKQNKFFDQMSINFAQIERIKYIQNYFTLK